MNRQEKIFKEIRLELKQPQRLSLFEEIGRELFAQIEEFEGKAQNIDTAFTSKLKLIWVLSGSGSISKSILDHERGRIFANTDRDRIKLALKIARQNKNISILYNGTNEQNSDLVKAIRSGRYDISLDQVKIIPGEINCTLDQVRLFSYPADISIKGDELFGVLSHAPHLVRVLRMMAAHKGNFKQAKILPIPLILDNPSEEEEFIKREIIGTIDYILKNEARREPYGK